MADELTGALTVPVLLVRPGTHEPDLAGEPRLRSVVIPLDGTTRSDQVVEPALQLGLPFGAEFILLRVNEPAAPSRLPVYTVVFTPGGL